MEIGSKEWSHLIINGADRFNIDLNHHHTDQYAIHARELTQWTEKINITSITDPFEIAVKHFLDSLAPAPLILPGMKLLDIGSGGGFPGLPLKVLIPSMSVTLIDASRKKVSFLKHVIRTLTLDNIHALHSRAEDLLSAEREQPPPARLRRGPRTGGARSCRSARDPGGAVARGAGPSTPRARWNVTSPESSGPRRRPGPVRAERGRARGGP